MASYIHDGWTRDGYVAAEPEEESGERLCDSLSFTYRPATRLEVIRLDKEVELCLKANTGESAVKGEKLACDFIANHLVSWDLKNVGNHEIPISSQACERMHPFLFSNLYKVIRGTQASDKKPEVEKQPASDEEQLKN